MPKELPWRANLMIFVLIIALWVVIFRYVEMEETWSFSGLFIIAGAVVGVAFLIYAPRISLWIAAGVGCVFLFRVTDRLEHWQVLVPWVVLAFGWVSWLAYQNDHLILQRLDALHEKMDKLQDRVEKIESKLDG
jgi:ABC-type Na+ efflux pump permease subunit